MKGLDRETVRRRYNERGRTQTTDAWHRHTASRIDALLLSEFTTIAPGSTVLFTGSGGRSHGLPNGVPIHVDVAERVIRGVRRSAVGDAEQLPIQSDVVDAVICVGSVINYCDAAAVISEAARVLTDGGRFVLDVESSNSLEFFATKTFRRPVDLVHTFFNGEQEDVWVYSRSFISKLLDAAGFSICRVVPIHVVSPLRLRFSSDVAAAARWSSADRLFRRFGGVFACNFVFFCRKGSASRRSASTR